MAVTRRRGRSAGENTADEIRQVALDLFFKRGFQATTLRHIASRVGIQVGSLYNHITSKGDLLFDIMETVMLDLLEDQRQVLAKSYLDRAVELLQGAIQKGFKNANDLKKDAVFDPLRSRDDFTKLLSDLEANKP